MISVFRMVSTYLHVMLNRLPVNNANLRYALSNKCTKSFIYSLTPYT